MRFSSCDVFDRLTWNVVCKTFGVCSVEILKSNNTGSISLQGSKDIQYSTNRKMSKHPTNVLKYRVLQNISGNIFNVNILLTGHDFVDATTLDFMPIFQFALVPKLMVVKTWNILSTIYYSIAEAPKSQDDLANI